MSTILKALEKARRERESDAREESSSILDVPPKPAIPPTKLAVSSQRRMSLVVTGILTSTLVTLVVLSLAGFYFYKRFLAMDAPVTGRTSVIGQMNPALGINPLIPPGDAFVSASGPNGTPTVTGKSVPAPPVDPLALYGADVSVSAGGSQPGRPGQSVLDLPTPVPMSELAREEKGEIARATPSVSASPTAPAKRSSDEALGFTLGPILYDPRSPMAIVNGLSVREGGVYENFRVLRITPDSVTVQRAGETPIVLRKHR